MPTEEVDRYYYVEYNQAWPDGEPDWYADGYKFDKKETAVEFVKKNMMTYPDGWRIIERVVIDKVILTEGESNGRDSQSEGN